MEAERETHAAERALKDALERDGSLLLASLVRLAGDLDVAEDALQEACARAWAAWRDGDKGVPARPAAWLNTVSRRIVLDRLRRDRSAPLPDELPADAPEEPEDDPSGIADDRLRLLFTCCHPALAPRARQALALRTLGGLGTAEIARAFVEPEATCAQRLVRAKRKIREARIPYEIPPRDQLPARVGTVLAVLYLIFNEGYAATDAPSLVRVDLVREAIRLARLTVALVARDLDDAPAEAEARGLLALMLLTDARRPARLSASGALVPLEAQDRSLWDRAQIAEGSSLLDQALALGAPGPYQIQAAIAALHDAAETPEATDWRQISLLYEALQRHTPTAIVALNAAVAHGMVEGPEAALARLDALEASGQLRGYHLLPATRADLLRRLGRHADAAAAYEQALALVQSPAERAYLERRLMECR